MSAQTDVVPAGTDSAAGPGSGPARLPDGLAEQLVAQARSRGIALTGPGGLLTGFTKQVLETALNAELAEHLGMSWP